MVPDRRTGRGQGIPYVGAMISALYVPSAGEGSDRVPGRDEFWYEEKAAAESPYRGKSDNPGEILLAPG